MIDMIDDEKLKKAIDAFKPKIDDEVKKALLTQLMNTEPYTLTKSTIRPRIHLMIMADPSN